MKFYGKIKDRTLKFNNIEYLKNFLRDMKDDQDLVIDIEKRSGKRSLSYNDFYWGVILQEISLYTGHTSNEIHNWFKAEFIKRKYLTLGGKKKLMAPTTTTMLTKEFTEYVEQILAWSAQELGMEWNL